MLPGGSEAEGILRVCERQLESPLECASGATGSNLKKRIGLSQDGKGAFASANQAFVHVMVIERIERPSPN